jgi:hypothetical protein
MIIPVNTFPDRRREDIYMRHHALKIAFLAVPVAGLLAFAPAVFAHEDENYNNNYESPHGRMHDYLNEEHEAEHDSLEAQHDAAHQYPMTRREHRALHRALKREHREAHRDLRDQHEGYHDYDQGYYGNYGRDYDGNFGRGYYGSRYRNNW